MSCKRWWRRGDDNLTGTSGRDWLFGGRGNNTIDGRGGNDFIWSRRGDDEIDGGDGNDFIRSGGGDDVVNGGAGNDRVYAGRGNDTGIYSVEENRDSTDYYHGGRGNDVLILQMTHAEFNSAEVQADLQAFDAFLARHTNTWSHHPFKFQAFDLKVKGWESYEIQYTDAARSIPPNSAPVAGNDTIFVDASAGPILEVETNDPDGLPLSASAQVIERSSFRTAPDDDVGDPSLPRVSIEGNIAASIPIFGPAANDVDLYAISLDPGEKLILDIDFAFVPGSQMNAQLFLMDASGTVLAENDNAPVDAGGTGSVSPFDPYLEFTDSGSGGTYYVAVSAWNNDPDTPGYFNDGGIMSGDYVLNVSIDNASADLGAFVISSETLLSNDSDAEGDSFAIIGVGNAINGSVELTTTGEILLKLNSDSPASFEYTISDSAGGESTATVTVNGNAVVGSSSDDVLFSTSGNDLLTGGGGSNTFTFSTGSGNDTIADFQLGSDVLAFTDVMSTPNVQAQGNDTLVNVDAGDSVLLVGVSGVTDINDLLA
ncbi:MAG: hypothetical protein GWP74_00575 [Proteobacteria bacterium]|jgi:Ca2+-binding RTX toxin-like protein|nr:hypothetical protein [Pseudomonadota bacterium]